jgi:hypothetical protein
MNNESDELNEDERRQFANLAREKTPPDHLEEIIVRKLKDANLISSPTPPRKRWSFLKPVAAFAGLLLIFMLGATAGTLWFSAASAPLPARSDRPQFILLLRAPAPEERKVSPAETLRRVKEYSDWAKETRQRGFLLQGEKLKDEMRILTNAENPSEISAKELNQPVNTIKGYFLIEARDYEQAEAIARSCPHIKYGGRIEVREIERF